MFLLKEEYFNEKKKLYNVFYVFTKSDEDKLWNNDDTFTLPSIDNITGTKLKHDNDNNITKSRIIPSPFHLDSAPRSNRNSIETTLRLNTHDTRYSTLSKLIGKQK